jgi:hypothetical protein
MKVSRPSSRSKIIQARNQNSAQPSASRWFLPRLKMEVIRSSNTLIHIRTTRPYIPEDGNFHVLYLSDVSCFEKCSSSPTPWESDIVSSTWAVSGTYQHCSKHRACKLPAGIHLKIDIIPLPSKYK